MGTKMGRETVGKWVGKWAGNGLGQPKISVICMQSRRPKAETLQASVTIRNAIQSQPETGRRMGISGSWNSGEHNEERVSIFMTFQCS